MKKQTHTRAGSHVRGHFRAGKWISSHTRAGTVVSTAEHPTSYSDHKNAFGREDGGTCRLSPCVWCSQPVYYYRSNDGGFALFDELGVPWPIHQCWQKHRENSPEIFEIPQQIPGSPSNLIENYSDLAYQEQLEQKVLELTLQNQILKLQLTREDPETSENINESSNIDLLDALENTCCRLALSDYKKTVVTQIIRGIKLVVQLKQHKYVWMTLPEDDSHAHVTFSTETNDIFQVSISEPLARHRWHRYTLVAKSGLPIVVRLHHKHNGHISESFKINDPEVSRLLLLVFIRCKALSNNNS